MNKKMTAISIISLLLILAFSGCTESEKKETIENDSTNNNDYLDQATGVIETFTVDTSGGEYSLFEDKVKINIKSNALDKQTDITVETIENPVDDTSVIMFSCFEFSPDGTTFNRPIDIIIRYDEKNLPEGVDESDVKIYLLNNNKWEVIEDSFANQAMHWSVASVSHFSKMGGGAPAPSINNDNDGSGNSNSDDENGSAQYWFKANLAYYNYNNRGPSCHPNHQDENYRTEYHSGLCAWWDPVSYVQYYEIKFDFNGNPPAEYCPSCDYRDWGKSWCELSDPYFPVEGYIYHLGGEPDGGYIGTYDTRDAAVCSYAEGDDVKKYTIYQYYPEEKHGFPVFAIHDNIRDVEELSEYDMLNVANSMETFVFDYTDGWVVWVRGVTETQS